MSARSSAVAELRGAALPAFAFALVAFAGYASGRSPWHSGGGVGGVSGTVVAALAGVTGAVVVGALLAVWVVTPGGAKVARRRRRLEAADLDDLPKSVGGAAIAAVLVTVAGLVVCAALWPLLVANRAPTTQATEGGTVAPSRPAGRIDSGARHSSSAVWLLVGAAVTLAVVGPVALVGRRRLARRLTEPARPDLEEQLAEAVTVSLSELESMRDPRTAIERTYVRFERSLGQVEVERGSAETPSELLGRLGRVLVGSGDSVSALTRLFEIARFSAHDVGEQDRREAVASLRAIETELAARNPAPRS
jgi:hypothetical protein